MIIMAKRPTRPRPSRSSFSKVQYNVLRNIGLSPKTIYRIEKGEKRSGTYIKKEIEEFKEIRRKAKKEGGRLSFPKNKKQFDRDVQDAKKVIPDYIKHLRKK